MRPIVSRLNLNTSSEILADRVDLNDANMPFAATMSKFGDLVFVSMMGNNFVDVIDAYPGDVISTIDVGAAPQGLALGDDGRLYVQNFMDRSLSIADVSTILDGTDNTYSMLAEVDLVDNELLSQQVLQGKTLFYSADTRISDESYISCASCHLDGGQDGRVWDFTDRGEGFPQHHDAVGSCRDESRTGALER